MRLDSKKLVLTTKVQKTGNILGKKMKNLSLKKGTFFKCKIKKENLNSKLHKIYILKNLTTISKNKKSLNLKFL